MASMTAPRPGAPRCNSFATAGRQGGEARIGEAVKTADDRTEELEQPTRDAPREPRAGGRRRGSSLDRYRLMRRLGAGGFGVVWLAHDERLDRDVAVKRIAAARRRGRHARRSARRVAAARLAHPAIVALYEAGARRGAPSTSSPSSCAGRTLARAARRGRAVGPRRRCEIGVALCDALAHAHERGVVHRDVKPPNVLVPDRAARRRRRVAKLTDFGVARIAGDDVLTRTGDVVGTLAYMAPEQAEGRARRPREADLYALGARPLRGAAGVNPVRGARRRRRPRAASARALPPLGAAAARPAARLCGAIDRARLAARPSERGTLADLRDRAGAARWPRRRRRAGHDRRGSPLEPRAVGETARAPAAARRRWPRLRAAWPRGGRAAGALRRRRSPWLGPARRRCPAARRRRRPPRSLALAAAARWAGSPLAAGRRGLAGAAPHARPGAGSSLVAAALPVAAAAAPRAGRAVVGCPRVAPLLGLAGLAGAYPALAGQAARPWHRAALGALGAWWLLLAEAARRPRARARAAPRRRRPRVAGSRGRRRDDALVPPLRPRRSLLAALWAIAASSCPCSCAGARSRSTSSRRRSGPPALGVGDAGALAPGCAASAPARRRRGARGAARRSALARPARRTRALPRSIERRTDRASRRVRPGKHRPDERPAQPREQDRRPRRGHVRPRLPLRGAAGRARAQARAARWTSTGPSRSRAPTCPTSTPSGCRRRTASASRASSTRSSTSSAAYLLEHARRERLALVSRPQIEFRTDERLRARRVRHPGADRAQRRRGGRTTPSRATTARRWSTRPPTACSEPLDEAAPRRAARARWSSPRASATSSAPAARSSAAAASATSSLDDSNVSRRHAEIRPAGGDGWTIADLGSTNGVRVNGRRDRAPRRRCSPATRSSSAPSTSPSRWSDDRRCSSPSRSP